MTQAISRASQAKSLTLANSINAIELGSTVPFYIDEFRLWNATLADETIQKIFYVTSMVIIKFNDILP
jgi:hypothetical protein